MRVSNLVIQKSFLGAFWEQGQLWTRWTCCSHGAAIVVGWILQLLRKQLCKYSRCVYCKYFKFQTVVDTMKEIKQGMGIACIRAHRSGSLVKTEWSENGSMRRWHWSSNLNKEGKGAMSRTKVQVLQAERQEQAWSVKKLRCLVEWENAEQWMLNQKERRQS